MSKLKIDSKKCPQDHPCPLLGICPVGAISQVGYDLPRLDEEKCVSCGGCVVSCPYGAVSFD
ncbi:MAG: 4Fe-4S binding protein [Candidatus Moranbacteria bacterium]|nr:4Fe-4S binding protein [Candidatus Moranbacteria bacterium]